MSSSVNSNHDNGQPPQQQQQLQLIPETILKKKHNMDDLKAKRESRELYRPRGNKKVFSARNRSLIKIKKPETFVANARMRKHHMQRYNRVSKKGMQKRASSKKLIQQKTVISDEQDPDQPDINVEKTTQFSFQANSIQTKFVFAIRIRTGIGAPYKIQKALRSLRLNNLHEGIFLKYTPSTQKLLHLVEPFVLYGIPSQATVTDLVVRRGHARIHGKRVPLSDNRIVEDNLGKSTDMSILCLEDIIHEIIHVSNYFTTVVKFLAPFSFTDRKSQFQKRTLDEKTTHEYGDQGELIDDFIRDML